MTTITTKTKITKNNNDNSHNQNNNKNANNSIYFLSHFILFEVIVVICAATKGIGQNQILNHFYESHWHFEKRYNSHKFRT